MVGEHGGSPPKVDLSAGCIPGDESGDSSTLQSPDKYLDLRV